MTAEHPKGWYVGQNVWLGNTYDHSGQWATVTKIGRRWIVLGDYPYDARFDADTRESDEDDKNSYFTVYLTQEDHAAAVDAEKLDRATQSAWADFRQHIPWGYPPHLTLADIANLQAKIVGRAAE